MATIEALTTENLRQFTAGIDVLLPFSIDRAPTNTPIHNGDDWEVRIVKPRGGGMIVKTADWSFPDANVEAIQIPIDALDFDRAGTYYYQVIKTTSGKQIKSDVRDFEVKPSLPIGLPVSPPTSPSQGYFPFFDAQGKLVVSSLQVSGAGLFFNGSRVAAFNGTQHSIPFFGASSAMTENTSRLKYENTANNERLFVSGRKADGAFRFEFDGWNGAAYTTGMYIKSTNASGYFPKHLVLENVGYGSIFSIAVNSRSLDFLTDHDNGVYKFLGYYENTIPLVINAGTTTFNTPRIYIRAWGTTDVLTEFRAYAGQTANIWEYRNSAGTLITALTASGGLTMPQFASNSSAANNTIFWNTTDSKLRYKDPSGTVTDLN